MSLLVCVYLQFCWIFFVYAYVVILLGTFLVNYVSDLVLFGSGSIQSFVSRSFCWDFSIAREALDQPSRVVIADDRTILASIIYRNCVLEIFGVGFPFDLIPITMGDVYVIFGID